MPICLDDGTLVSYIYEPNYLKDEKYKELKTQITYEKYHLENVTNNTVEQIWREVNENVELLNYFEN